MIYALNQYTSGILSIDSNLLDTYVQKLFLMPIWANVLVTTKHMIQDLANKPITDITKEEIRMVAVNVHAVYMLFDMDLSSVKEGWEGVSVGECYYNESSSTWESSNNESIRTIEFSRVKDCFDRVDEGKDKDLYEMKQMIGRVFYRTVAFDDLMWRKMMEEYN